VPLLQVVRYVNFVNSGSVSEHVLLLQFPGLCSCTAQGLLPAKCEFKFTAFNLCHFRKQTAVSCYIFINSCASQWIRNSVLKIIVNADCSIANNISWYVLLLPRRQVGYVCCHWSVEFIEGNDSRIAERLEVSQRGLFRGIIEFVVSFVYIRWAAYCVVGDGSYPSFYHEIIHFLL
jgi:hypothetical protein